MQNNLEIDCSTDNDIAKRYAEALSEFLMKENKLFTYVVNNLSYKPIKGEATEGKLRYRGIKLIQKRTPDGYERWLEQRGVVISPTTTFKFEPK
jgi:hypothetical protein